MITLNEIIEKQKQDQSPYKVAVCITSYNQKEYIEDALKSVLHQKTDFPFLIVVGDDFSTDGSVELLKKYQREYPEIIKLVLQKENHGLFYNRRQIIESCDAPYIAFCDGDDYWTDDHCLQKKVDFLESHLNYIGYQTGCYCKRGDVVTTLTDLEEKDCCYDFTKQDALKNQYPGLINGFFFRNIYRYMPKELFEIYMDVPIDDSGKLPIVAGIIAPIYRQDHKATFIYRYHDGSMERENERVNMCQRLFLSHLKYDQMIKQLFGQEFQMDFDDQLMTLITDAFVTAAKSTFRHEGQENWRQFRFLYHYGYFSKSKIRKAILKKITSKLIRYK